MKNITIFIAIIISLCSSIATASPEFLEAVKSGNLEKVKIMIKNGEDVNQRHGDFQSPIILYTQGFSENLEMLKILVNAGADIKAKDKDGSQLILKASQFGSVEYVEYLISKGADVNTTDKDQAFPLYLATSSGKADVAKALIKGGADVNKVTGGLTFGYSPLISAVIKGNPELVKLLLDNGADKSYKSSDGSALDLAIVLKKPEIIKLLKQ